MKNKYIVTISLLFIHGIALAQDSYDVVVYGGTPGGVIAAVAAAREGAKVLLIEQTNHIGGLNSSGIGTAESEHMIEETISGLPLELYKRIGRYYGRNTPSFYFESHVFEKVCNDMLIEAKVKVLLNNFVAKVVKIKNKIQYITLLDSKKVSGKVFIDATYEGDLMARSGVSYTYGRESKEQYGESLAGIRFIDQPIDASPYDDNEKLLTGFVERSALTEGQGDKRVMNYNFRLTISSNTNRRAFPKPEHYNPKQYLLLSRLLSSHTNTVLKDIIDIYSWQYPAGKFETNNKQKAVISLGYFGGNLNYPDADYKSRKYIYQAHKNWTLGLMYFLANDTSVPIKLQKEVNQYGLSSDEFIDNQNFPYYLYIREARRMKGEYIQTQNDILINRTKPDAIALGSHWIDSHHVQRVAISKTQFVNEGRIWEPITRPYELSYRIITPKQEESSNLLVPVCVSASHVGFCSIRVESTWMQLGNSAGIAAAICSKKGIAVQKINVLELQNTLKTRGVIIDINYQAWDGTKDISN